jgi:uncharacterized protein YmfQ (DUF2313 family)
MGVSAEGYRAHLQALLPAGGAWPREAGSALTMLLDGLSLGLARVDSRIDDLVSEACPASTLELLDDWERVAGLPDDCAVDVVKTLSQRRATLVQRLSGRGGQSREYFLAVTALLGFTCTLTEFDLHTCNSTCEAPVTDLQWRFAWQINVSSAQTVSEQTCEDTCETALASWGNAEFECTLRRLKPAHTLLIFTYGP